jgi:hypothetical protein
MNGDETRNEPGNDAGDASGATTGSKIEIASDEDWKSRVKAEDAALDQQFHKEDATATPEAGGPGPPERRAEAQERTGGPEAGGHQAAGHQAARLPEPSFATLISMLSTQAMVALGLLPNPMTKKAEKELPVARYFIDLIGVLEKKTAGNLDREEAAALDETLHTLRMAFVQRSKESA